MAATVRQTKTVHALIFDIQRFSIHDGPGIRTTVFFKGCPLRCRWCQNPESLKSGPEIAFYRERCVGCLNCRGVCPEGAIRSSVAVRIDRNRCTGCGRCAEACENRALKRVGLAWDARCLVDELLKDRDFFADSGGGVTLSGGEPTLQAAFLADFLPRLKNADIHVNLETCGMFAWPAVAALLPCLDSVYFDLKLMNPRAHRTFTGADNGPILDNFHRLAGVFPDLQPRMPVIPTITDTTENIGAICELLNACRIDSIHLLPYHRMGEAKIERMGTDLNPLQLPPAGNGVMAEAVRRFAENHIRATPYD